MQNKPKYIFLIIISLMFFYTSVDGCNNRLAVRMFKNDLKYIELCIDCKENNYARLPQVIKRIEEVTSIVSESDGSIIGKFYPTKNDLLNWKKWFKEYKRRLSWSRNRHRYILLN